MRGGPQPGSGRKRGSTKVVGGRPRMRGLVDDPKRIAKFRKALDAALDGPDSLAAVTAYLRVFEHGYGRPPQALDVKLGTGDNGPIDFRILDATGAPFALGAGVPAAVVPLPGEAAE